MAQSYPTGLSPVSRTGPAFTPWSPGRLSIPGSPANDNSLPKPANDNLMGNRRVPQWRRNQMLRQTFRRVPWIALGELFLARYLMDAQPSRYSNGYVKLWEALPTHVGYILPYGATGQTWYPWWKPPFPPGPFWANIAGLDGQGIQTGGSPDRSYDQRHILDQLVYGIYCQEVAEYARDATTPFSTDNGIDYGHPWTVPIPAPWEMPYPYGPYDLPAPGTWGAPAYPPELMPNADDPFGTREGWSQGQPATAAASGGNGMGTRWVQIPTKIAINPYTLEKLRRLADEYQEWNSIKPWDKPNWYDSYNVEKHVELNVGRSRAPKRTKEVKVKVNINASFVGRLVGSLTEFADLVNALWDALPPEYRSRMPKALLDKNAPRAIGPMGLDYRVMERRLLDLYRHLDKVDVPKAIKNIVRNEIGDRFAAGMSKKAVKAWRQTILQGYGSGGPFGPQIGPAL